MKRKVLIVDDEKNIRESVRDYLELCDYEVKLAANGIEGIEYAIEWQPHVVLSDLRMPVASGYDVVKTLRGIVGFEHIPIIIFSAIAEKQDQEALKEIGATSFVAKPFRLPELVNHINLVAQGL
jgi:CheY-like chemotaxis protein